MGSAVGFVWQRFYRRSGATARALTRGSTLNTIDALPHPDRAMNEPANNAALAGVRVLELGSTVAGPFCARLLGDFGAEVIKIEAPDGDQVRSMGNRYRGKSLYAASMLRNKRLAVVDLRKPEGQDVVRRIASRCDVLVENFRPGTIEGWGLGYAELSDANPGLVLVRVSGFGQDGPYSSRAGYGIEIGRAHV